MNDEKDFDKNDYLWDGSGTPDPEIVKLEGALGKFRQSRPAPDWPVDSQTIPSASRMPRFGTRRLWWSFAAAAASLVMAFSLWWAFRPKALDDRGAWGVTSLEGAPRVGKKSLWTVGEAGKLRSGQTLETDTRSRASISVDEVGRVEIEPRTRLRLVESGAKRTRLSLERGTIHAMIWAPPGEFLVDTPSALAVDLGCAYTLIVDDTGAGILRTTLGWVGFKLEGREAFIPAGAVGATRPEIGPGTPYYEDATEAFREALTKFDFDKPNDHERDEALSTILRDSRKRDALTLWHLLSRTEGPQRRRVYDRLAALVPPPSGVTSDGIVHLDREMLDAWWNELGFGDISLWRTWERSWTNSTNGRQSGK
jgi:FecR protein